MNGPLTSASTEKGNGEKSVTPERTRDMHRRWALTQKLIASRTPNYVWVDAHLERHEVPRSGTPRR